MTIMMGRVVHLKNHVDCPKETAMQMISVSETYIVVKITADQHFQVLQIVALLMVNSIFPGSQSCEK